MCTHQTVQIAKNSIPSFHHVHNFSRAKDAMQPFGNHSRIQELQPQIC